jgi:tetratricopeptide (TPR) repeat protein
MAQVGRQRAAWQRLSVGWLLLWGLLVPMSAQGQQNSARLQASATRLSVDDELTVQLRASGSFDEVSDLASEGFDFRQAGHNTQVNLIGSQMARAETWTFVGTPRRPGKYTIGPVQLKSDGQIVAASNALQIEVVNNDAATQPSLTPQQATDLKTYTGQAFFVRPQLSTTAPYVGQPFVLSYEVYWTRTMRIQSIRETTAPKWGNVDVEDVAAKDKSDQEEVRFDGRPYERKITHQVLLTSPSAGKVRIEGPTYRIEAGDMFETRARRIAPPVLELDVRPIPTAGRPASYVDGNVGRLTLAATLTRPEGSQAGQPATVLTDVKTGERLLLEYVVSGDGNLLGLQAIQPPAVPGMTIEVLPTRTDAGVQRTPSGAEGKRTWQAVVSFARAGKYTIPALDWTAFDPFAEKFQTSRTEPFEVTVIGPPQEPVVSDTDRAGEPGKPHVAPASEGLRPIAATARLATTTASSWVRGPLFPWLAGAPWLGGLLLAAWLVRRRRVALASPQRQREQALTQAQSQLDGARTLGPDHGYAALREAVAAYLLIATGVQPAGLTDHALADRLKAAGADGQAVDQLVVELQHCDFARFAPGGDRAVDLEQTARRLADVLARIDHSLLQPGRRLAGAVSLVLLATALLIPGVSHAATLDQTFAEANKAYVAGHWGRAHAGYESLLAHDVPSPAIQYNLGNTLVKEKQAGRAIGHYEQALRMGPDEALRGDIVHNLGLVRAELADRARKQHATLHVFDESPELDVVLARAAPEALLGVLALLGGFGALILIGLRVLRRRDGEGAALWTGVALCLVLHIASLAWLGYASRIRATVVQAVVVEEDASLAPCQGVGETIGLPEGLLVRRLGELPDGRMEVRLPNGRQGCLMPAALYVER